MLQELERTRFRRGENADRPYGGFVADTPFAMALSNIAADRGFESQNSLARALGKENAGGIKRYYTCLLYTSPSPRD